MPDEMFKQIAANRDEMFIWGKTFHPGEITVL